VDHSSAQCDGIENVGFTATVLGNSYILSHTSGTYSTPIASRNLARAPNTLLAIPQEGTAVLTSESRNAGTITTTTTTKFQIDFLLTKKWTHYNFSNIFNLRIETCLLSKTSYSQNIVF
jgi:hypothetical protein